ncbi:MAG: sensor histidine kinase, partial [Candidatus Halalkalibacterium sp. M3_1C_030]
YRKIRAIEEADEGEGYWMGTYGEGILHLKDGTFRHLQEQDGLANNTVLSVEKDEEGAIWFATYGGVSRYKEGDFTNYTIRDGLPNNGILDILKDRDGNMWFSTFSGISMLSDDGFITITEEEGLPDEVCYFILQDNSGIYWIGTKIGVVRFDYELYKEAVDDGERRKAFKLITQDQGLIANETNAGAGYKDENGILWFGTVGGLTRFDPEKAPVNNAPPKVHIENVSISGEPVENRRNVKISSENKNIGIEYIGISFSAPEQVLYEYRLRGSGEGWQQTNRRSVRYSALLPGDYTFQVRAQNNDGIWSEETASLSFTVMAPFWMQWWFVLLVLVVLIGIFLFIYNYYRVKKMVDIERMRVRIASDLHDDVGSALTEIALQSDFLQTTDVDEQVKQSLDQIGTQSRKIVSSLDDIVWSIDARNDTLGDLTDRMQDYINNMLPQKEVQYQFDDLDMDDKIPVSMKENLYLIFKEAVNNIAKHSDADKVEVVLKDRNGSFDLYIHDNGQGIKPERKSGQGLRNMKMRAKRIDAGIEFENEDGFTVHVFGKGI